MRMLLNGWDQIQFFLPCTHAEYPNEGRKDRILSRQTIGYWAISLRARWYDSHRKEIFLMPFTLDWEGPLAFFTNSQSVYILKNFFDIRRFKGVLPHEP